MASKFEARLVTGGLLKKVVEPIKDLIRQGTWDCSGDGLVLQAMDNAHVCLVAVSLKSEGFDHYKCDRDVSLGVDMDSMARVLKCAAKDDIITLSAVAPNPDTIKFTFETSDQDRVSEYEMKLMNIEDEKMDIPDTEYRANITMPSMELQRIIRDISQFGDTITIAAVKDCIQFSATGSLGSGNVKLSQNATEADDKSVTIDILDPVTLQFAGKYLNMFLRAASLSSRVTLSLSSDIPLMMTFNIGEIGHLKYYLAPKIEDE